MPPKRLATGEANPDSGKASKMEDVQPSGTAPDNSKDPSKPDEDPEDDDEDFDDGNQPDATSGSANGSIGKDFKGYLDHAIHSLNYYNQSAAYRECFVLSPMNHLLVNGKAGAGPRAERYLKDNGAVVISRTGSSSLTKEKVNEGFTRAKMWAPSIVVISDVDRMTRDMAGLLVDKVHEMQRNCSPILMICTATDVTAVRQNVKDLCFEVKLQELED